MAKSKSIAKEVMQPYIYSNMDSFTAINPDIIINNLNVGYQDYENMEIDNAIAKNLKLAKAYPNKYKPIIKQGKASDKLFEFIKSKFDENDHRSINLQTIYDASANALYQGFSVLQTLYADKDELQELRDFTAKNFVFDNAGNLKTSNKQLEIIEIIDGSYYSFIVIRTNMTNNNYYGTGVAQALYYIRELKKEIQKTKQISMNKYGVTPYIATTKFSKGQEAEFAAAKVGFTTVMENLRSGGFGVVNGEDLNIIPLLNSLSINDLIAAEKELDIIITGLMSGATDSLESSANGSQARATVQDGVVKIIQEHHICMIEKATNALIRSMSDMKFVGNEYYPIFSLEAENTPQFKDLLESAKLGIDSKVENWIPFIGEQPKDESESIMAIIRKNTPVKPAQTAQFAENVKKKSLNLQI